MLDGIVPGIPGIGGTIITGTIIPTTSIPAAAGFAGLAGTNTNAQV